MPSEVPYSLPAANLRRKFLRNAVLLLFPQLPSDSFLKYALLHPLRLLKPGKAAPCQNHLFLQRFPDTRTDIPLPPLLVEPAALLPLALYLPGSETLLKSLHSSCCSHAP